MVLKLRLFDVPALLLSLPGSLLADCGPWCVLQVAIHHQAQRQHRGRRRARGLGALLHPLLHGVPRGGGPLQVGILWNWTAGTGQVMGNKCQLFHPSPSSSLGSFSLFELKLLCSCCLMICGVTPESGLVLKVWQVPLNNRAVQDMTFTVSWPLPQLPS